MGENELDIMGWDIPIPGRNGDIMGWDIPIPGRDGDIMGRARCATAPEGATPSSRGVTPRTREKHNDRMAISFSFVTIESDTREREAAGVLDFPFSAFHLDEDQKPGLRRGSNERSTEARVEARVEHPPAGAVFEAILDTPVLCQPYSKAQHRIPDDVGCASNASFRAAKRT
jgi:hypothetical protein